MQYKVYFEDEFFKWLDGFILSMKKYYANFYSNTWLYDEDKIVESYFENYENLKREVLIKINDFCKIWILWRKILHTFDWKENCSFIFVNWNYKITFNAIKDDKIKQISVYNIKIEV